MAGQRIATCWGAGDGDERSKTKLRHRDSVDGAAAAVVCGDASLFVSTTLPAWTVPVLLYLSSSAIFRLYFALKMTFSSLLRDSAGRRHPS